MGLKSDLAQVIKISAVKQTISLGRRVCRKFDKINLTQCLLRGMSDVEKVRTE